MRILTAVVLLASACAGGSAAAPAPRGTDAATPARPAAPPAPAASAALRFGELCSIGDQGTCERLCDEGSALSCTRLGRLLIVGGATNALLPVQVYEPDPAHARAVWQKACDRGYLPACNELAWLLAGGHGGAADVEQGRALNRRACDAGLGVACYDLVDDKTPAAEAVALYEKGCAAGHSGSCLEAGEFYETGEGVPEDMSKAMRLYGRAFFAPTAATGTLACPPGTRLFREVNEIEFAWVLVSPALYCGRPGKRRPVKHGPYLHWASLEDEAAHPHGIVDREGLYVDGKEEGPWVKRRDSGEVFWRGTYRAGKEEGVVEEFDSGWVTRISYVAGERHGPWRQERGDDRVEEGMYENGKKVGPWVTRRAGVVESEHPWVDGKSEGDAVQYHANGKVAWRTTYRDDRPVAREGFDREGRLIERTRYRNGKRAFTEQFYHRDGGRAEIEYDEDGDEINRREWDARGKPIR